MERQEDIGNLITKDNENKISLASKKIAKPKNPIKVKKKIEILIPTNKKDNSEIK